MLGKRAATIRRHAAREANRRGVRPILERIGHRVLNLKALRQLVGGASSSLGFFGKAFQHRLQIAQHRLDRLHTVEFLPQHLQLKIACALPRHCAAATKHPTAARDAGFDFRDPLLCANHGLKHEDLLLDIVNLRPTHLDGLAADAQREVAGGTLLLELLQLLSQPADDVLLLDNLAEPEHFDTDGADAFGGCVARLLQHVHGAVEARNFGEHVGGKHPDSSLAERAELLLHRAHDAGGFGHLVADLRDRCLRRVELALRLLELRLSLAGALLHHAVLRRNAVNDGVELALDSFGRDVDLATRALGLLADGIKCASGLLRALLHLARVDLEP